MKGLFRTVGNARIRQELPKSNRMDAFDAKEMPRKSSLALLIREPSESVTPTEVPSSSDEPVAFRWEKMTSARKPKELSWSRFAPGVACKTDYSGCGSRTRFFAISGSARQLVARGAVAGMSATRRKMFNAPLLELLRRKIFRGFQILHGRKTYYVVKDQDMRSRAMGRFFYD